MANKNYTNSDDRGENNSKKQPEKFTNLKDYGKDVIKQTFNYRSYEEYKKEKNITEDTSKTLDKVYNRVKYITDSTARGIKSTTGYTGRNVAKLAKYKAVDATVGNYKGKNLEVFKYEEPGKSKSFKELIKSSRKEDKNIQYVNKYLYDKELHRFVSKASNQKARKNTKLKTVGNLALNFFIPVNKSKQVIRNAKEIFNNTVNFKDNVLDTGRNIKNIYKGLTKDGLPGIKQRLKNATINFKDSIANNIKEKVDGVKQFKRNVTDFARNKVDKYIRQPYQKVKNVVNKGKAAYKFVKNGGIGKAIKNTKNNIKNRVSKFNSVGKNLKNAARNPRQAAKNLGENALSGAKNYAQKLGKNGLRAFKHAANDVGSKIAEWLIRNKKKIITGFKIGVGAIGLFTLATFGFLIIGAISALGKTPHYYCDLGREVPSLIKNDGYWEQYCSQGHVEDVVYFQQNGDHFWSSMPYNEGTIGTDGCGPTSFTMAAATFKDDLTFTPDLGVDYYTQTTGEGQFEDLNLMYKRGIVFNASTASEIETYLDEGCFVQICMGVVPSTTDDSPANGTSAHYVLLVGYDDSGYYVADPYTPDKTTDKSIPGEGMGDVKGTKEEPFDKENILSTLKGALGGSSDDNVLYCPIRKR